MCSIWYHNSSVLAPIGLMASFLANTLQILLIVISLLYSRKGPQTILGHISPYISVYIFPVIRDTTVFNFPFLMWQPNNVLVYLISLIVEQTLLHPIQILMYLHFPEFLHFPECQVQVPASLEGQLNLGWQLNQEAQIVVPCVG